MEALKKGDITTRRGLNQEISLRRYGDTRWGSHYITLIRLVSMYSYVLESLEIIVDGVATSEQKTEARVLIEVMQSFDFVFIIHFMRNILAITNELSQSLQRNDQDIDNAMRLVEISKKRFQEMRDIGWVSLLEEVSCFCKKELIDVPKMDDSYKARGRSRRKGQEVTNLTFFCHNLFYDIIDKQMAELNIRFNETSTERLLCVSCLNPSNGFSSFNKDKLVCLAKFYEKDFSAVDIVVLGNQLKTYIMDVSSNESFSDVKGIASLAEKMVETKKHFVFPLFYMLITLALTLPVATATVERVFSAMNIVKTRLRNRMSDKWMNDSLIAFIEKEIFEGIKNETIMHRFQAMKTRKELL